MSQAAADLAVAVIGERFGPLVCKVANIVLQAGTLPLPLIVQKTKLKMLQVRKALCVLCEHSLITIEPDTAGRPQYKGCFEGAVNMLRVPRCVLAAKTLYGEQAEAIIEELAARGQLTLQDCITRVGTKLEGAESDEVKKSFVSLVETQFVKRCGEIVEDESSDKLIPKLVIPSDPFKVGDKDLYTTGEDGPSASRKRKLGDSSHSGSPPLWTINFERFSTYIRDELMVEMVTNLSDKDCGMVVRALLRESELKPKESGSRMSAVLSAYTLSRGNSNIDFGKEKIDRCLKYIVELQNSFLKKVGDSGGGMYVIDYALLSENLCRSVVESVVRERFGTKGLRVFRVLLEKNYLEQDQIENLAMLGSKEAKELTYQLLSHRFIFAKEVCKTADFAPSRTFYLFNVNLTLVARYLLETSYKTIMNIIKRRENEHQEHKSLLERQEKVEAIVASIEADDNLTEETKAEQINEIQEVYMTEAEKNSLEKYKRALLALHRAEIHMDHAIFMLQVYLQYRSGPSV